MSDISEIHLRAAIETTGMGIFRWDALADEINLDPRACAILGLDEAGCATLNLETLLSLLHPDDRDDLKSQWQAPQEQGFRDVDYRRLFDDGSVRWVSCSGTFIEGLGSQQPALIGTIFDVTEKTLVHQQLMQAQKMEAVGQLTAGISHNFNNILSAILPNLQFAAGHVAPEGKRYLRNARTAAERATDLVSELMVVAGRREGQEREALDLYDVADRVVRICRTTFGGWIQLVLEMDEDCAPVLGNEGQLEQVLLNLLLNARDAFEEAAISCPRVDIELEMVSSSEGIEQVMVRVADNGPGMAGDTLQRVFEPFFTTKGSGTGLGLATAYAIVSDHGGAIQCWSEPEQGTRFEVLLPAHKGRVAHPKVPATAAFIGGSERILVVDDDTLVRRVTTEALRQAGYVVLEAARGAEALELQSRDSVDLVVLDMAMPEQTGDQVLEALRARDPNIKVLIFTGLTDFRVARLGDVTVLQKPAAVNQLLQAVRSEIDKQSIN